MCLRTGPFTKKIWKGCFQQWDGAHIVLDLSCRKKEDGYYVVTDRWQQFTDMRLTDRSADRAGSLLR